MAEIRISKEYALRCLEILSEGGNYDTIADEFGITKETARRYVRHAKRRYTDKKSETPDALISELSNLYTKAELQALIKGKKTHKHVGETIHDFSGDRLKIGYITDTHIGSKYFDERLLKDAFDMFRKEGVDMVCHTGDLTEGMYNGRPGHVFECTEIGYERQLKRAVELFKPFDHVPLYIISGNHDATYKIQSGANIVKEFCGQVDNAVFMGDGEGTVWLGKNQDIDLRLWHGLDGNSYATSYRPQKIVESFTGGNKPNILFCGHTHKELYMFERHIHVVSGGACSLQSYWMRQKRLANHAGFHILDITLNDSGVGRFKSEWFAFYA